MKLIVKIVSKNKRMRDKERVMTYENVTGISFNINDPYVEITTKKYESHYIRVDEIVWIETE